jgi:hypothetical protein
MSFLDVRETKNNYYIIQEFCDSGDFAQYLLIHSALSQLKKLKTLPEAQV